MWSASSVEEPSTMWQNGHESPLDVSDETLVLVAIRFLKMFCKIKEGVYNINHSSFYPKIITFDRVSFSVEHRRHAVLLWCNMKGICDESVWLKSRTEHDNWTNLSTLSCSPSDFNHTLSSETPLKILPILIHILQNVGQTLFYLCCLRSDLNEIWHEDGPLDPYPRKNTTPQLPRQPLPWWPKYFLRAPALPTVALELLWMVEEGWEECIEISVTMETNMMCYHSNEKCVIDGQLWVPIA